MMQAIVQRLPKWASRDGTGTHPGDLDQIVVEGLIADGLQDAVSERGLHVVKDEMVRRLLTQAYDMDCVLLSFSYKSMFEWKTCKEQGCTSDEVAHKHFVAQTFVHRPPKGATRT